jgi:hypothetical protein
MSYNLDDFAQIQENFENHLIIKGKAGEADLAISCGVYNGIDNLPHIPEACNLAVIIDGIHLILKSPKEEYDCEALSPVFLCQLGILREYIEQAMYALEKGPAAKASDKLIKVWANFVKHPGRSVISHRCIDQPNNDNFQITGKTLLNWEEEFKKCRHGREKDSFWKEKKDSLADLVIEVCYPTIEDLEGFFIGSSEHIKRLIDKRHRQY